MSGWKLWGGEVVYAKAMYPGRVSPGIVHLLPLQTIDFGITSQITHGSDYPAAALFAQSLC